MFILNLVIFLCFATNYSNGQTDPTLMCIANDGTESLPPCEVNEGDGTLYIKVLIKQSFPSAYSIQKVFSEDSTDPVDPPCEKAKEYEDYIPLRENLFFIDTASAPTDFTESIEIVDDMIAECDEEFVVDASFIKTSDLSTVPCSACNFVIRIIDDDSGQLPTVSFDKDFYTVKEGDDLLVGVKQNSVGSGETMVGLSAVNSDASSTDYTLESNPTMISVQPNSVSILRIPTVADEINERPFESFQLTINENANYIRGKPYTVTVYINDPEPVQPTFEIEYSTYGASETQTPFTFNIKRSSIGTEETVAYSTRDVSARAGDDYRAVLESIATFSELSDTFEGSVDILPDNSKEEPEIFEISINNPSIGNVGTVSKATVTLYDASSAQSVFVLDKTEYSGLEGNEIEVKVLRQLDVSQPGSIRLQTSDIDTMVDDYNVRASALINFAAKETERTQSIYLSDDSYVEDAESFQLSLSEPIGGVVGAPQGAIVRIQDDDYCYYFATPYISQPESSIPVNLIINKRGYLGDATTVVFQATTTFTDDNALEEDFRRLRETGRFPAEVSQLVVQAYELVDDEVIENDERFNVKLINVESNRMCEPSTAIIIIQGSHECEPPCLNGFCASPTGNLCNCATGYTGDRCGERLCTVTCQNNGICSGLNTCLCPTGYTGPTCALVNCPPSYCLNGATCESTTISYRCRCDERFRGDKCEQEIPSPESDLSPGIITAISFGSAVGLIIILGSVATCFYLLRRRRFSTPTADQLPLQPFVQGGLPQRNGILMDGSTITYPYIGQR